MEYSAYEEWLLVGLNNSPVHAAIALLGSRSGEGCEEDPLSKILITSLPFFDKNISVSYSGFYF